MSGQDDVLSAFVGALDGIDTTEGLQRVLTHTMHNLGFRHASYHVIRLDGDQARLPYAITDYPVAWIDHYLREGYLQVDPILQCWPSQLLPFRWSRVINGEDLTREQKRMFDEARDAGIHDGFSVPIHGQHGEYAAVTVVPEPGDPDADKLVAEKQHLIHLLALYFDRHARSPLVNDKLSSRRQKSLLSPREQEILRWTALGKTSSEVATICGIAPKSVEFHLDNAKKKLGTFSKTHLVVKALVLGLLKI